MRSGYITMVVDELCRKHDTRDPYKLCKALGIEIIYQDLGKELKAYYYRRGRMRYIILNNRLSRRVQRILLAHELGHDVLHKEICTTHGFQESEIFNTTEPVEYEANIFAAHLLIDSEEVWYLYYDERRTFFDIVRELYVPAAMLDFKFRIMKREGYEVAMSLTLGFKNGFEVDTGLNAYQTIKNLLATPKAVYV